MQCPGMQISVLIDTDEVTDRIFAATGNLPDAEANDVRKAELTNLDQSAKPMPTEN